MVGVIIICALTCFGMIISILAFPTIKIKKITLGVYWLIALAGAMTLAFSGLISLKEIFEGFTSKSSINPIKILVLFLSMTVMSIFLNEAGFFEYIAIKVLSKAKSSQRMLFLYLFITVSILTIFTSNDIIILTFTPFICYFAKGAKINPIPYLVAEFVAANTWSMALIIGNPTNIYIATAMGIGFIDYSKVMVLPAILSGIVSYFVLYIIFSKKLKEPVFRETQDVKLKDKNMVIVGGVHLALCTFCLIISSYIKIEMWLISFAFMLSMGMVSLIMNLIRREKHITFLISIKHAPWELVPFVLSMFILVIALDKYSLTAELAFLLSKGDVIFNYSLSSMFVANLMNNIPMSVLFSSISLQTIGAEKLAAFSSIAGSNIGAFLTPVGALAGIMWSNLIKREGIKYSFAQFVKYGFLTGIPAILAAIAGIHLMQGLI